MRPDSRPAKFGRNQATPVAARSSPLRLSGRHADATGPQAMKIHPTSRPGSQRLRSCHPKRVHSTATPAAIPRATAGNASVPPQSAQAMRAEIASPASALLCMNPLAGGVLEACSVGPGISAGDQYHGRWVGTHGELLSDREPIDAGELGVQQHDTGPGRATASIARGPSGASPTTSKPSASRGALAGRRKSAWSSAMSTLVRMALTLAPRRAFRMWRAPILDGWPAPNCG